MTTRQRFGYAVAAGMTLLAVLPSTFAVAETETSLPRHPIIVNETVAWESNAIPVQAGRRYIFSDQYLANVTNEIDIRYMLANGSHLDVRVEQFGSSRVWNNAAISFAAPPNAVSMVITHRIHGSGYIVARNFKLVAE